MGDFNGDGRLDLVVATSSDTVSVLLGNGDGTFQAAQSFAVGSEPVSHLVVGDFNSDGKVDLAVLSSDSQSISMLTVLLSQGDGTFQAAQAYAVGLATGSPAVGDLNGDGKLDLVIANPYDGTVGILLGNGDGSFQVVQNYAVASHSYAVVIGDFNQDGSPDLLVANSGTAPNFTDGGFAVLLGNGDGTFQAPQFTIVGSAGSVVVGDLNGDGKLDVAVANGTGYVRVLLGNGDGTFQAGQSYATGDLLDSIAVADVNGDGFLDLVVKNPRSATVSTLIGKGDGTFEAGPTYDVGFLTAMALGDFNADGHIDLAVTVSPALNILGGVSILMGQPDGTFRAPRAYPAGSEPIAIAVADFNNDGVLDLAVANYAGGTVSILLGKGDGTFGVFRGYQTGAQPFSLAVADFNGDGALDLAVACPGFAPGYPNGSVRIFLGKSDGTFGDAQSYAAGSGPWSLAVGDFNGDGIPDLAVANYPAAHTNTVSILLGNGDGTFRTGQSLRAGGNPVSIVAGDFNRDGKLDLAVANVGAGFGNSLMVLMGNGDGTFQPAQTVAFDGVATSIVTADLNGDGLVDLAVSSTLGVTILLSNGDGTFQKGSVVALGNPMVLADFNGDGILDFAAVGAAGGVSISLGNGDGTFQPVQRFGPRGFLGVAAGDFNRDGFSDLVVIDSYEPASPARSPTTVTILLNAADW